MAYGNQNPNNNYFEDDDPLNTMGVSRRSLVLFFLIDISGSMKGTKIGELNTAMEEIIPEIRKIGEADTEVKIAVLTFSTNYAWMYHEPISVEDFEWSRLSAEGITNMGAAFEELAIRLSRNSFLSAPSLSFAPVIFLMTDGYPTDDYKAGLKKLQANNWYRFGLKAALGIGREANDDMLAEFTTTPETVVHAYSGEQLAQLIKTVAVTSSQIGSKSMTLSDDNRHELSDSDTAGRKQSQLGQQIQDIVGNSNDYSSATDSDGFDIGW